jgi:hypothetical protein
MALVILTGASGSGKTTIAERIEQQRADLARVFRFDSIGVPSPEERIAGWGSGGGWQRATTIDWLLRIAKQRDALPILFEGQMRLSFIKEGLANAGIGEARVVFVHCDDATRTYRLCNERKQPELANAEMMNWAKFPRDEAETGEFELLDTSKISIEESVKYVSERLGIGRSGRFSSPGHKRSWRQLRPMVRYAADCRRCRGGNRRRLRAVTDTIRGSGLRASRRLEPASTAIHKV